MIWSQWVMCPQLQAWVVPPKTLMLHGENWSKWVIRGQEVANLLPKTICSSSLLKNEPRLPDLSMALIVKIKHLRDNLPDALQSSWCNAMQQEVPLKKKRHTASGSQESTCVPFLTHSHPWRHCSRLRVRHGRQTALLSSPGALMMLYNTEMDKRVSQPVHLPYLSWAPAHKCTCTEAVRV